MKKVVLLTSLVGLAIPIILILWFVFTSSLMSYDEIVITFGSVFGSNNNYANLALIPSWPTLQPLIELLLDTPEFFAMFWNSIKLVVLSVGGQLIIATPAAWALSRFQFKYKKMIFAFYVMLMLMPFQVTMVPNYLVLDNLNIIDTVWAIVLPFTFSAFPVFVISKNFDAVPRALLEAAAIDGADRLKTFIKIGIPLGVPGIMSAVVLGILESWNTLEQPISFLKTKSMWPLSLYLPQITSEKIGLSMVASLFMFAPPVIVFLCGQKYLELGIQAAGLKE